MSDTSSPSFICIKNATVLTMDPQNGTLAKSDILIQGDRIVAIGQALPNPPESNVTIIDGQGCIVTPGFVDGHHHMWQQLLRGVATDWSLFDYTVNMRTIYGSLYTPEDVYLSTYVAALSLINNGVTSVLEHCHIINSPDHADAAVKALQDAGIRGTFCYGFYANPPLPDQPDPEGFSHASRLSDAARIRDKFFGQNDPVEQLLTFGVAPDEPESLSIEETIAQIKQSRKLGARIITMHVAMGPYDLARRQVVQNLANEGIMGPDLVFSHGSSFTESELLVIKDSGASIVGTPDTELQMGMGFPIVFQASDRGCRTCLGIDITSNQGNDFIAQMRLALQGRRAQENEQGFPLSIKRKTADVLRMGTLGGAEVMRMEDLIGSITVRKKADLVLIRSDDIENIPAGDPIGSVVFHSSVKDIDTVIIDGKIKKQNGKLVADWERLKEDVILRADRIKREAAKTDLTAARKLWMDIFHVKDIPE
ncbi:putative cytosine deaminase and related metal-dependent hydrolases [Fusarium proliferatum ET1]|uniref:Probable cytosine deaminase and related metal-dependent hydrolases n=1 Tax=Fusarium proliferatum (strain ET1) TaxID=1227346 RepID=A0A1L7VB24_FUSPR|nr:putative cytosine deaminase and related metal-dependent hydrolases [Fusarium proliferatum ET1]CZR37931.1 probable cytosine deaminase and related metal-dependent hydrolases [Fusarium proliferatum ET1]